MKSTLLHAVVITLLAVLFLSPKAWGVDCMSSSINLLNQAAIDNFQVNQGGGGVCDTVTGDLKVQGDSITNIDGLADLTNVGGLIIRTNPVLSDVDGLANLTSVDGAFFIDSNAILSDVDGLANLTNVGSLRIRTNPVLSDLDGLANVATVGSYLAIHSNAGLGNLDGLANVTTVGTDLTILSNVSLTNLDGLANLTSVVGYLDIDSNVELTNIDGLANLISVGGYLRVQKNDELGSCSALAPLLGWPDGPPNDNIGSFISVRFNKADCDSVQQILDSVSGPSAPSIDFADAFNGQATLTFSPPTTTDAVWPVTSYYAECLAVVPGIFENNTVTAIPDQNSVVSPLIVSGSPFIHAAGLTIPVNITHPRTRHLTLTLTSPSGTSVMLWNEELGSGTDLVGTFPTTLEPTESLDAFDGEDFNGEWQLTVADGVATHTGTLNSWGLTIGDKVTAMSATSPVTLLDIAELQPYTCTVAAITGLGMGPASNAVEVDTTPRFSLGGDVGGLEGSGLVLQNITGDEIAISDNGGFTFDMSVKDGTDYVVTVKTQPTDLSQTCDVTNGSGTMAGSDVSDILVTCITDAFTVGGNVTGLEGSGLVLQNNAGDDLAIGTDGSFAFAMSLDDGTGYAVTVNTQPTNLSQTCSVINGNSTLAGSDVIDISVTCITDTFTVGGNLSGLAGSGLVLQNNAGDDLLVDQDGSFTFAALDDGTGYAVTVKTQPTNLSQTCDVTSGSGTLAGSDVADIVVTCITNTFTVGGNVTGLEGSGLVLQNNAGDDLAIGADGGFTFAMAHDDGTAYAVTVETQPTGGDQTCTVSNGSGTLAGSDVTEISVDCAVKPDEIFENGFEGDQ